MAHPSKDPARPITSRALKSCMDVLRPQIPDATVLDLFAGHGRFSQAALKEGASKAVLVETHRPTTAALQKAFAKQPAEIVCADVFSFLEKNSASFDIVFVDPPFSLWNPQFEAKLFDALARVKPSITLVKHPKRVVASDSVNGFTLYKTSVFGDSKLLYYRYGTD